MNEVLSKSLISFCCKNYFDKRYDKEVRGLLTNPLEWDFIIKESLGDGTFQFIYPSLKKNRDILPENILNRLEKIYRKEAACDVYLLYEAEKALRSLNQQKIPVMALKGTAFAETIYSGTNTRAMCDIDILVREKDLDAVEKSLFELGYVFLFTVEGNHSTYVKKEREGVRMEVHWDIYDRPNPLKKYAFGIDLDEIWEDAVPIKVGKEEVLGMSPEDLVIYLCCHGLKDFYTTPKWLIDFDRLIKYYGDGLDWKKVIEKTERYRVKKTVYYSFEYVNELFNDLIPKDVLAALRPMRFQRLDRFALKKTMQTDAPMFWRFLLYFCCIDGLLYKIMALSELPVYRLKRFLRPNIAEGSRPSSPC